jgi:hypothetical protein
LAVPSLTVGDAWALGGTPSGPDSGRAGGKPVKRPFRVIYVEGGSYEDYYLTLSGLVRGLHTLGLVRDGRPPVKPDSTDTLELWQWLSRTQGTEELLEFPEDGFYSAGWSMVGRDKVKRAVTERVRDRGDVDLILAFGTRAGLDFVLDNPGVPVMSLSAIDPEGAGFAPGDENAVSRPWAHVFVKRDRIPAQLSLFHGTFGFGRLGVPVEEDPEAGRLSMAWPAIEEAATELGFRIVPCYAAMEVPDRDEANRNLMECLEYLSRESDAIYLTVNNGMLRSRMGEILAPISEAGLPSFSQEGSEAVRSGVLMSAGQDDYDDIGLFEARALREILYGATPGKIPGIYRAHASVAINLTMALRIGWNPPFEILVAADRIYQGMAEPFRAGHPSWAVRTEGLNTGQASSPLGVDGETDGDAGGAGAGEGAVAGIPDGAGEGGRRGEGGGTVASGTVGGGGGEAAGAEGRDRRSAGQAGHALVPDGTRGTGAGSYRPSGRAVGETGAGGPGRTSASAPVSDPGRLSVDGGGEPAVVKGVGQGAWNGAGEGDGDDPGKAGGAGGSGLQGPAPALSESGVPGAPAPEPSGQADLAGGGDSGTGPVRTGFPGLAGGTLETGSYEGIPLEPETFEAEWGNLPQNRDGAGSGSGAGR